jgi:hypothetical protein
VKTEIIDLKGALDEATRRVLDITPSTSLPMPKSDDAHTTPAPMVDVFGD